jgi:FlaA1/EpsC-like NDP-sugar epimerase
MDFGSIFTSSDKAVNPTNVMGTSKLMGERLMSAANVKMNGSRPLFASTRFGNVLGSRGSVIPIFREQIRRGGPVTITDRKMTRFIMSIRQAVRLVIDSARHAKGGEVFVTKMPAIRIQDLAEAMIEELSAEYGYAHNDIRIEYIGTKPGEKIYEELMSIEEVRRAIELERYFVVIPAFIGQYPEIRYEYDGVVSREVTNPYHSGNETPLQREDLLVFMKENDLLVGSTEEISHPAERYWPNGKRAMAVVQW